MSGSEDLDALRPARIFDGGDLDCGSGLVLLIRENMSQVPPGEVLEMQSREATVADDLPPWCRMVGHDYLGALAGEGYRRYFIRKGTGEQAKAEEQALSDDKARARDYEWRLRVRATGSLKSTAYFRNFKLDVGQPASFEEKDANPSAVELLLAALGASLSGAYATECAREGLELDDVEITVKGRLNNVLAHLGLEDGDPSFARIELKCFASSLDDEAKLRAVWERTLARSPLACTLGKAVTLDVKFSIA